MLVTVTGGTGFVGSHTTQALLRRGHRVRLLVRNEANVERALRPLGVDPAGVDVTVGDVTDEASVQHAVRGADAVLHAASVFSFDSRERAKLREVNVRGTEIVLGAARAADARVVYVSSVVAMMPSRRRPLTADSPVGRPRELYMATKAAAEVVARRHQEEGAPVAISYPPGMVGPHDPHLGDLQTRVRSVLRGQVPMWPTGGLPLGDVRDTAELHAAMLDSPDAALQGRYFGPSHYLTTRELVGSLRKVTGRALPTIYLPALTMLPVGVMAGFGQRFLPFHIPADYGGIYICRCATRVDEAANAPLGIRPRPATETMADTVRWLHGQGLLSDRQAGLLAGAPAAVTGEGETRVRATP